MTYCFVPDFADVERQKVRKHFV